MRKMILLLVMLMLVSGSALAQDAMPVPCGTLPAEDCEFLQQSQAAMLGATSYNFALNVDLNVGNIPDFPNGANFNIAGTGAFSGDMSMFHMSADAASEMAGDPAASMQMVQDMLGELDADLSLVITLPEDLVEQGGGDVPAAIPLELRLVDGTAYLNLDPLREVAGENAAGMPEGWYGLDLVGLMDILGSQMTDMGDMSMEGMDPEMFSQFTSPEFINQYVQVERQEDSTSEAGEAVRVYVSTIDYGGLLGDPAIQALILEQATQDGSEMTAEQLEMVTPMLAGMFEGLEISVTQTIGDADMLTRSVEIVFDWDMGTMAEAIATMSGEPVDEDEPLPNIHFSALTTYSNFNAIEPITAPEDATIVPLESLGLTETSAAS